jgi:hypothetical protein
MTKKRVTLVAFGVVAALVVAGGLMASNMGFKLNYPLLGPDNGATSFSGTNSLGLPFNQQLGLNNALDVMNDIGFGSVDNMQRFLEATDGLSVYTGRTGSPLASPFAISSAEGYFAKVNTDVNYIVVGSHNPSLTVNLQQADNGLTSKTGTNFFSYPYHSTSANSLDLMNDVTFASVDNVQRFLTLTDGLAVYTGRTGSPVTTPFGTVPGEAYFIKVNSTVAYVPSHY